MSQETDPTDAFLMEHTQQHGDLGEESYYPGETGDGERRSAQCPVVPNIPVRPETSPPFIRRLTTDKHISEERER